MSSHVMSFQKKSKQKGPTIPGTKPSIQNAQLLVSTGIASLDYIIGGGLPVGTIILVDEDIHKGYSKILLRYFLAEGVASGHSLFVASQEEDTKTLVSELPLPLGTDPDVLNEKTQLSNIHLSSETPEMKIAWRYEKQAPITTDLSNLSIFGHFFDLSKPMDRKMLDKTNICHWNGSEILNGNNGSFCNTQYLTLLQSIKEQIITQNFCTTSTTNDSNRTILRVGIQSIGSPFWTAGNVDNYQNLIDNLHDLSLFFYCLRAVIRSAYAVAMVTIPGHLFKQTNDFGLSRVMHQVDTAISLESFAGSDKETNPIFKDYHGLFKVDKLSAINTITPHLLVTRDLAFKLRRKKFCIEKLHLPPELQESTEREQEDLPSMSCGSSKKHLLEF